MPESSYPKTLTVESVGMPASVKHTWFPTHHPFNLDGSPAPKRPGLQVPVGKPVQVEILDARHEELIRTSHRWKVVESKAAKEEAKPVSVAPAAATEEPKTNGAEPEAVQAEAPAKKSKEKAKG
jgi:hypothetical protein